MAALEKRAFEELLAGGCVHCGRSYLTIRALATGTIDLLEADAVSPIEWTYPAEALPERIYRVECAECAAILFERDDCPLCGAGGGLAKALSAQNGMKPLGECPRCHFAELTLTVEARLRIETLLGRISRRVAEAESHEAGFHIIEARCQSCEETVAQAGDARCPACGRSRLLRKK